MSQSFGDQLCEYLAAQLSSTLTYGTNLFSGRLQDQPDLQAAIWVGAGAMPPAVMDGSSGAAINVDEPTAQVMVRGTMNGYTDAEALIQAIYKVLQSLDGVTLIAGGLLVKSSWPLQSPAYIGRDENSRHLFTQNFRFLFENTNR